MTPIGRSLKANAPKDAATLPAWVCSNYRVYTLPKGTFENRTERSIVEYIN
jgi:hypothetical protein